MQTHDGRWAADSPAVARDPATKVLADRNRSNLRVFEEGLDTEQLEYSEYSERARRRSESERLVALAKAHQLYYPLCEIQKMGSLYPKRTGESSVYYNSAEDRVYKVKDPYAKSAIKSGVLPEDAIREHLVYNTLFPETALILEGITDDMGDVRIVLSQRFIPSVCRPTKAEIKTELAHRGLVQEDAYFFGNDYVSVTDIEGDNVLKGFDGKLYFIDPIIRFKRPMKVLLGDMKEETKGI